MSARIVVMFALFLALALGLLAACVPPAVMSPGEAAAPTPSTPSAAPLSSTVHTLAIIAAQAFEPSRLTVSNALEVAVAEERYAVSVDELLTPFMFGMPGIEGLPRLALARVVTDVVQAPAAGLPITWVLFTTEPVVEMDLVWHETEILREADGTQRTAMMEHRVQASDVVPFPSPQDTYTGLSDLVAAREGYRSRTGRTVWIDHLLMAEPDPAGAVRWVLYAFNDDPGGGAGDEARRSYCCRLLRCGSASTFGQQVNCWVRCRGISC